MLSFEDEAGEPTNKNKKENLEGRQRATGYINLCLDTCFWLICVGYASPRVMILAETCPNDHTEDAPPTSLSTLRRGQAAALVMQCTFLTGPCRVSRALGCLTSSFTIQLET